MKKFFVFFSLSLKPSDNWEYELEGLNQGVSGTYLIKVWVFSKKPNVDFELAKKMAIHGVIFKGYSGSKGLSGQPPLSSNPNLEEEKKEFFTNFFGDKGVYYKFINASSDQVGPGDRIKVGKMYKIGVVMSILKDDLRKHLENAGIIKSLSNGF